MTNGYIAGNFMTTHAENQNTNVQTTTSNTTIPIITLMIIIMIAGNQKHFRIDDVTIGGTIYCRCVSGQFKKHSNTYMVA